MLFEVAEDCGTKSLQISPSALAELYPGGLPHPARPLGHKFVEFAGQMLSLSLPDLIW